MARLELDEAMSQSEIRESRDWDPQFADRYIEQLEAERNRLAKRLQEIEQSKSWRLTAPLRWMRSGGASHRSEPLGARQPRSARLPHTPSGRAQLGEGKRIALVIRRLVGCSGGAERLYCELANMLAARGYEVTCLHFDQTEGTVFYPLSRRVELINLAPAQPATPAPASTPGGAPKRKRRVRRLIFRMLPRPVKNRIIWRVNNKALVDQLKDYFRFDAPDVAISFLPPANTPALLAASGTRVKVIPTNHNVPKEDYLSEDRWDPNPVDRALRLKALHGAERIHVLFPTFGAWFPEALRDKIVAIPNYVSAEILREPPRAQRDKVILAVGRLATVKNYDLLAEAWSLLAGQYPGWQVVVYGEGPQRPALTEQVQRLGIGDRFSMPGSRRNLGAEYARAAIFCHPAAFEGFGLSVAEALALKTPVVAFADCAGVNEFVADGSNGLMVDRAGGAEALAEALKRLMDDEELRRQLGENGPKSVAAFSEERFADAWERLIEAVTAPAGAASRVQPVLPPGLAKNLIE